MNRRAAGSRSRSITVPRRRGDEPVSLWTPLSRYATVPRRRGDEPGIRTGIYERRGLFPAGAGMNRSNQAPPKPRTAVPRRRGDEPGRSEEGPAAGDEPKDDRLFPAGAGMNRAEDVWRQEGRASVPRRRGDEPAPPNWKPGVDSVPRRRGDEPMLRCSWDIH